MGTEDKAPGKLVSNCSLHWLTATIPRNVAITARQQAAELAERIEKCTTPADGIPSPRSYTRALALSYGTLSWHPDRPDMRICYNAPGSALEQMFGGGLPPLRVFYALRGAGARFTRVDMALDYPDRVDLGDIIRAAKLHPETTRARTLTPYDTVTLAGEVSQRTTGCYVGSTRSDRFLCCYDKGLELGVSDLLLTRIEARNRKVLAQQAADMLADNTLSTTARTIIRTFADFPVDWWQSALSGPVTELPPVGRKDTDTTRWLCEQVAPVLAREIGQTGGMESRCYQVFAQVIIEATPLTRET